MNTTTQTWMTNSGHFNRILWGFVFTILDVRLGEIDTLPDSMGYFFVALGAGALSVSERQFGIARFLCWLLVPLSLYGDIFTAHPVLETFRSVLDCAMIWFLLGGIMLLARARGNYGLARRAEVRRLAYIVMSLTLTTVGSVLGGSMIFAVVIFMFTLLAMIVHLLYQARAEL